MLPSLLARTGPRRLVRGLAAAAALLALPACLEVPAGEAEAPSLFAFVSTVSRPVGDPLPQAPIAGGDILVKGPSGYCVDGSSLRNRASGGFALLASCFVMSGGKSGAAVPPVVMTVSASPLEAGATVPDAGALAAAFAPTPVLARSRVRSVSLVHLAEGGDSAVPEADPRHWRGAMELNGYLVLLAAYGPRGSSEAGRGGSAMILDLAQALRAAKPATVPAGAGVAAAPKVKRAAPAGRRGMSGGLLR